MKVRIVLWSDYWHLAPQIKVDINGDIIWSGTVNQNSPNNARVIEHEKEISDGTEVKLNITLENKVDEQTQKNDKGEVYKDQLCHIEKVEIDGIDFEEVIYEYGIYTPIYPKGWLNIQSEAGITVPTTLKKITTLGFNGTWCLSFKVPVYLWFLENTTW